jgi:hypothetical protein
MSFESSMGCFFGFQSTCLLSPVPGSRPRLGAAARGWVQALWQDRRHRRRHDSDAAIALKAMGMLEENVATAEDIDSAVVVATNAA